ncbi:GNAT superfamily N-acetyltransferase [Actinokineospora baliensis]|uniref:GNAT family N-acetyltransferase n=1 Tax=Actinokineospora baliensis TaxID=547056 RepID=UPI00195C27CD|nr:GNAT family N-acetyltransferase [Actinokineospora baliensis]MBM7774109.1 GNAT superfamily N-acetyltransferase [Actinokineospora baliensis]
MTTITRAGATDVAHCAAVVARAFEPLPQTAWLVDTPSDRLAALTADFEILVEHAVTHGHIDTIDDDAVAVWFHREHGKPPAPADYDVRVLAATGRYADRFHALDAAFDAHHPSEPHHHLGLLAVAPSRQGHGLGAALLRHHHAELDDRGLAAFLEASTLNSRRLYLRAGYAPLGEPYQLPEDGPTMWPLWRQPR